MKKILIVNGYNQVKIINDRDANVDPSKRPMRGSLADTICQNAKKTLESMNFEVEVTKADPEADVFVEIAKWKKADFVIFQFPVYWMGMPGKTKVYVDNVFMNASPVLFENDGTKKGGDNNYGNGGLSQDKKFMVVSTWNAPVEAFKTGNFYDGRSVDEALIQSQKMMEFLGMKKLPSFSFNRVFGPTLNKQLEDFDHHIRNVFNKQK